MKKEHLKAIRINEAIGNDEMGNYEMGNYEMNVCDKCGREFSIPENEQTRQDYFTEGNIYYFGEGNICGECKDLPPPNIIKIIKG